jgi:TolA-binding protein
MKTIHILIFGLVVAAGIGTPSQAQKSKKKKDPATNLYFTANSLYNRKLYPLAAEEYEKFLAKYVAHPKAVAAQFGLSLSYFKMKKYDRAEPLLAKLAANTAAPQRVYIHLFLGQSRLQLKKIPQAEAAFSAGLKLSKPGDVQTSIQQGLLDVQFEQKKWKEVVATSALLAKHKGDIGLLGRLRGAQAMYNLRQFRQAETVLAALKPMAAKKPYEQEVVFLLAEARRTQGDLKGAATEYENAARQTKGERAEEALFRLGFVRFQLNIYDQAAKNFSDYRFNHKKGSHYQQAGILEGRAHLENKAFAKAESVFGNLSKEPKAGAEVFLWRARVFQRQEKYAEAVNVLKAASVKFAADPMAPELLFDLGNNLFGQEKYADAIKPFTQVIQQHKTFEQVPDAMRFSAHCLHYEKKFAESNKLCAQYLASHADKPKAADVAFLQAENLLFLKEHDKAVPAYQKFIAANTTHPQVSVAKLRVGQSYYQQKKWSEALKVLEPLAALKDAPKIFTEVHFMVGGCHYENGKWDKAITFFNKFAAENPREINADTALMKSGFASEQKVDSKAALATFEKLANGADYQKSVHLPHALVEIGRLQYGAKAYPAARVALQKVIQAHAASPMKVQADYYLGWVALGEKKPEEAAKQFGAVADSKPKHELAAAARLQQGMALLGQGKSVEAQTAYQKFAASYPSDAKIDQAIFYLGKTMIEQKQWDPALAQFAKLSAMTKSELRDRALYESAWAEKMAGRSAKAMVHYEALLAGFPQSELLETSTFELAELEFEAAEKGAVAQYDAAIGRLTGLVAKTKNSSLRHRAHYRLGWCHFNKRTFDLAAKSFETVLADKPPKEIVLPAAYQAGEARLKRKEFKEAMANYQKAVAANPSDKTLHEQAQLRLGESLGLTGGWPASEETYAKFIASYPKHDFIRKAHLGIGWAQQNQKKYAPAIDSYQKVAESGEPDEDGARAQFQIGECHLAQNDYNNAIKEFVRVTVIYSHPQWVSKALLEMGHTFDRQGDALKAKGQLEAAAAAKKQARARYQEVIEKHKGTDAATVAKARLK